MEQKYNEIRKPVYDKRNDIIKSIPDFWLTAVSDLFPSPRFWEFAIFLRHLYSVDFFLILCSF